MPLKPLLTTNPYWQCFQQAEAIIDFPVARPDCRGSRKSLTVVISPLQSLMKDQVDNLAKLMITDAVAINGLLDPIERAKAIERVEDGSASC
jgi:ATP-dependent DNA helicase RecQ